MGPMPQPPHPSPSTPPRWRSFITRLDWFLIALLGAIGVATIFPAYGSGARVFEILVVIAVAWLFFLYGIRLKTSEALAAIRDWRLHSMVLSLTYVIFPVIGLACMAIPDALLDPDLKLGMLFMTLLPSTVQSSIAFVSIARGNVAGAVVAASFSNLAGIIITPILVGLLMGGQVGFSMTSVGKIALQLLAPFILGQFLRRWLAPWVFRHARLTSITDRGSVVLVVYSAFSQGVVDGIWQRVSILNIVVLTVLSCIILAVVLELSARSAKKLGFSRRDQAVIIMCGSKKSLATGVPMATILFPPAIVGIMVLPLMIFHQIQLIVCAVLAKKLGQGAPEEPVLSRPQPR